MNIKQLFNFHRGYDSFEIESKNSSLKVSSLQPKISRNDLIKTKITNIMAYMNPKTLNLRH